MTTSHLGYRSPLASWSASRALVISSTARAAAREPCLGPTNAGALAALLLTRPHAPQLTPTRRTPYLLRTLAALPLHRRRRSAPLNPHVDSPLVQAWPSSSHGSSSHRQHTQSQTQPPAHAAWTLGRAWASCRCRPWRLATARRCRRSRPADWPACTITSASLRCPGSGSAGERRLRLLGAVHIAVKLWAGETVAHLSDSRQPCAPAPVSSRASPQLACAATCPVTRSCWYFFPDFRHGHDPVVAKCECCGCCGRAGKCGLKLCLPATASQDTQCVLPECRRVWLIVLLPAIVLHQQQLAPIHPTALVQTHGARHWGLWSTPAPSCHGSCCTS